MCVCVCGRGVAREGHTYKQLRTESILYEGYWKDANDELSKNILVDEAWKDLRTKGCCRELWAEHFKWSGEAGRFQGIVILEPVRARSGSWTLGHNPVYKGKGKGKSKAKGKSKGQGKSNQG